MSQQRKVRVADERTCRQCRFGGSGRYSSHPVTTQTQHAARFRSLHEGAVPLLLANVWDNLSAAIVADAGLPAIATASAAVALSRGFDDGEEIPFDDLVQLVRRITAGVDLPVSVDFERGYGDTVGRVHESATRLIEAGAVGINIEDSTDSDTLRGVEEQCERIMAVRKAGRQRGISVFINARTDAFMMGRDNAEGERRLEAYVAAGADGVYPIACTDLAVLDRIRVATASPINVLLTHQLPPLSALAAVGVRRISLGPGLLSIAAGATAEAARRLADGDIRIDDQARLTTSEMRRVQGIES